jgi:hypothetical protein
MTLTKHMRRWLVRAADVDGLSVYERRDKRTARALARAGLIKITGDDGDWLDFAAISWMGRKASQSLA